MKVVFASSCALIGLWATSEAFVAPALVVPSQNTGILLFASENDNMQIDVDYFNHRRATLALLAGGIAGLPVVSMAEDSIFAPKFVQEYADFSMTSEGWSYRDVKVGDGESPSMGDRLVYDWSGYTIGYFGRPFEAKG